MSDKKEVERCCGTCMWFNGEQGDGEQFCDELETSVHAERFWCNKWRERDFEVEYD